MSAQSGMQTGGPVPEEPTEKSKKPLRIVDLEEQIQSDASNQEGHSFFFGEVGVIKFADGTSYHVRKNRALITDQKLADNLLKAAENPALKIFLD